MTTYLLKSKKDDKNEIKEYLTSHPQLLKFKKADYCLAVNQTHHLYKYQTKSNVWYVHFDPTVNAVFRICVYESK